MPEIRKGHEESLREDEFRLLTMAICEIGGRHCWTDASGNESKKFLVVVVDYFIKWVEAKALATRADQIPADPPQPARPAPKITGFS
jgi:hypothetical protein